MSLRTLLMSLFAKIQSCKTSVTVRNTLSGFVSLAWLNALSMITIPVYIHRLGVAEWGLVAACASLQILSNFIDAGFSQIVPRWAAHEAAHPERLRLYFVQFRRMYVGLGLLMFVILQSGAGYLSHQWFQVPPQKGDDLELAIRLTSAQFLFQFINNLHIGFWNGLQKQVTANIRACCFGTLKHVSALSAVMLVSPQAWIYSLSFAVVALLEVSTNAITFHKALAKHSVVSPAQSVPLAPLLREVSVLSGGILLGLLVSQMDRIVLSRMVDVKSFGIYTVVATLAFAFLQLQAPVTRAFFPVIVNELRALGEVTARTRNRLLGGTLLSATLPALLTCLFAPQLLSLWLHNPQIVSVGTPVLRLLLVAVAINSLYGCIYQVIVAAGKSTLVLKFNCIALLLTVCAIFFASFSNKILLGCMIWLLNTGAQLSLGLVWLNMQYRSKSS